MYNFNLLLKKVKKILISINELIESFFNTIQKFVNLKKDKKNLLKNIDNKIILGGGLIILSVLSYLLIPTFYDKNKIQSLVQNHIDDRYNLNIRFNSQLSYGLFPKPHFYCKNLSIIYDENEIAISKSFKVDLSIKNFFSFEQLKMKNVLFKKTEFNINSDSVNFFNQVFLSKKNGNEIIFKDSKIFYKDKNDELLFLSKISNLIFFIDKENLNNEMVANFEIFNVPLNLSIINNDKEKKFSSKLKSKKVRLKIENDFDYSGKDINGLFNLQIINDYHSFSYLMNKDFLNFVSDDGKFNGRVDFKPFYFISNMNFNQLYLNDMFDENSIITNLINSQILNNPNLNANLNLNFKKTSNSNLLENFILKLFLQEGRFVIKDSSIDWNNSILVKLDEVELVNGDNQIKLVGEVSLDFKDITKFYSYFQIRRNHRFNIKNMKIDFAYDLNQEKITLDNLKIDKKEIKNINNFLEYFNTQNRNIFNKVTFRNFVKDFFSNYEG